VLDYGRFDAIADASDDASSDRPTRGPPRRPRDDEASPSADALQHLFDRMAFEGLPRRDDVAVEIARAAGLSEAEVRAGVVPSNAAFLRPLDPATLAAFLRLPVKSRAPNPQISSRLHIYQRTLPAFASPREPNPRAILGTVVEARFILVSFPIHAPEPEQTAALVFPKFLEFLCQSYLDRQDALSLGRPALITTDDDRLARYLDSQLPGTRATYVDERTDLIRGTTPLVAIVDAMTADLQQHTAHLLAGRPLVSGVDDRGRLAPHPDAPPQVRETYRERTRRPGVYKSTVAGDAETKPRRFAFCASPACGAVVDAAPLKRCPRCRVTVYCNQTCFARHWKKEGHKAACAGARVDSVNRDR